MDIIITKCFIEKKTILILCQCEDHKEICQKHSLKSDCEAEFSVIGGQDSTYTNL